MRRDWQEQKKPLGLNDSKGFVVPPVGFEPTTHELNESDSGHSIGAFLCCETSVQHLEPLGFQRD